MYPTLFAAVQAQLAAASNGGRGGRRAKVEPSLLAGKLFDETGERLVPSHARKGERRYRYYVSASLIAPAGYPTGTDADWRGWRLPARELEQAIATAVLSILDDEAGLLSEMLDAGVPASDIPALWKMLRGLPRSGIADLTTLVTRVDLSDTGIMLKLRLPPTEQRLPDDASTTESLTSSRFVPWQVRRRGVEMRLVVQGGIMPVRDDLALLQTIARAHCWFAAISDGRVASATDLASQLGISPRYVQRLLPLALLAPSLVEQIASGQHDPKLSAELLSNAGVLPLRWADHAAQLGCAPPQARRSSA